MLLRLQTVLTCNLISVGIGCNLEVSEVWQLGYLLQLLNLVQAQLWVEVKEQATIHNAQVLWACVPVPELLQILIVQQHE